MLKRLSFLIGFLATSFLSFAQVTLIVDAIPSNTPSGDDIYVAGNFQGWDPGSNAHILQDNGSGQYLITLNGISQTMEYKFTRGSWPKVEGNASGSVRPNRSYSPSGGADTVYLQILSWEDLGGSGGGGSTANAGVQIMDAAFYMPQLNKNRRIWIYLPSDYDTSSKHYPVLYMHDGQNLFDARTSFSGEWQVDETLRRLEQAGDYGVIVVGIDNGGASRLDEYSPWVNVTYGGGDGDKYIRFITETLKPHIDSSYRTMPGRETTGIAGSSMGGLISYYAGMAYQDKFGKIGVFSPSFWFSNEIYAFTNNAGKQEDNRFYFLAGAMEGGSMVMNMQSIYNRLGNLGFPSSDLFYLVKADGQHSEWFWAREFGDAYEWLFSDLSSSAAALSGRPQIHVYPNPVDKWLHIETTQPAHIKIYDENGKSIKGESISGDKKIDVSELSNGVYLIEIQTDDYLFRQKWLKL